MQLKNQTIPFSFSENRWERYCYAKFNLAKNVEKKYFLSEKMIKFLMKESDNQFSGRYKPENREQAVTLTSRYAKMGKTDNYIISEESQEKEKNG